MVLLVGLAICFVAFVENKIFSVVGWLVLVVDLLFCVVCLPTPLFQWCSTHLFFFSHPLWGVVFYSGFVEK